MGRDDTPEPTGSARAAEASQADESDQSIASEVEFLKKRLNLEGNPAEPNPNPEVKYHGQIAEMTLPRGWEEAPPYRFTGGIGTRSFRDIHPPEAPRAILGFYYRGLPIHEEPAMTFHQLLQQPSHVLSTAELNSVAEVLRDKADQQDFQCNVARTEDLNGKRVLVVEGRYLGIEEDTIEIFVDARRDGAVIQEIYFQAPKDLYVQYANAAKDSMWSIRWI